MTDTKMDFFEIGDKTSLICADVDVSQMVRSTLRDLGFKFHTADTPELAIERIRYTAYDVIILDEKFAGSSLRSNALLNYLAPLPMAQRRSSFTCLIGPSFKTLDAMQAFGQSVHIVVHRDDLPNFTAILKKRLAEFELVYKTYKDTFASIGDK
jgi:hypothetical protein